MREFNYSTLKEKKWSNSVLGYIAQIHEFKGRQNLYVNQNTAEIEKLVEIAKVQSTEFSNSIEGIRTTQTRLKELMAEKTMPKNRDEEEIAGYRDALNTIHENYEYIPLTSNYILQLHKILFNQSAKSFGGKFKNVPNYITSTDFDGREFVIFTPLSPIEVPTAIEKICQEFNKALAESEIEPLILISIFIHDFLCIHPFLDGNGRMSRLLTTLLLYRSGYFVGKYISLEAKISKTKELYYNALALAGEGWSTGKNDPEEFIKYFLGVVLGAYRDFEERAMLLMDKSSALSVVENALNNIIGKFTKVTLQELCPWLGVKAIEKALKTLQETNVIQKHGKGKNTFYTKV